MANDEDSDESSAEVDNEQEDCGEVGVEEVGIEGDREDSESVREDKAEPSNEQEPMIDRDALSEAVEENHDDKEEEPTNEQELEGDEDQIERNTEEDNCEASNVSAKSDSDSRNDGSDEDGDINFEMEASSETVEDSQNKEPVDDEDGIIGDSEDELPNFAQTMIAIRKRALGNIQNAQGRQKKYYDAKHCKDKEMYKVGTLVLLKNSKKLSRKGSKLEPNWTGPYRINEVLKKGTFRLCSANNTSNVLSSTYNMARLKLYFLSEHSDSKQNSFAAPTVGRNSGQQHAPVQQEDMAQPSVRNYNNYLHL